MVRKWPKAAFDEPLMMPEDGEHAAKVDRVSEELWHRSNSRMGALRNSRTG
ncbi:MAG: hypothetical protein JWN24_3593 [Phycisphaerales bacterium]|nr:hypothetical protein [Phycisphaerales bacterium]